MLFKYAQLNNVHLKSRLFFHELFLQLCFLQDHDLFIDREDLARHNDHGKYEETQTTGIRTQARKRHTQGRDTKHTQGRDKSKLKTKARWRNKHGRDTSKVDIT
jgi:hypothetical protein